MVHHVIGSALGAKLDDGRDVGHSAVMLVAESNVDQISIIGLDLRSLDLRSLLDLL